MLARGSASRGRLRSVLMVALVAAAAGCQRGDGTSADPSGSGASLAHTCRDVAVVLRSVESEPLTRSEATTLRGELRDLAAAGDEHTHEPLNLLLVPLQTFVEGVDTSGRTDAGVTSTLEAMQAFDDGVLAFNEECLSVGARVL